MSIDDAIKRAYEHMKSHRAVAAKLGVSIAYTLYVLGYMSEELYVKSC
jgi:hypothetical protein